MQVVGPEMSQLSGDTPEHTSAKVNTNRLETSVLCKEASARSIAHQKGPSLPRSDWIAFQQLEVSNVRRPSRRKIPPRNLRLVATKLFNLLDENLS